jgi:hypothetical protein
MLGAATNVVSITGEKVYPHRGCAVSHEQSADRNWNRTKPTARSASLPHHRGHS